MIATIRFTEGLGNAAIYVRARDGVARFWDFQAEAWVSPETPACGVFLTEYPDSDPTDSLYQASITAPAGEVVIEYVRASDSRVLGEEEVIDGVGGLSGLASLDALKEYLHIEHTDDDAMLTRLLLAASDWFERQTGRELRAQDRTEVRSGDCTDSLTPYFYPVLSVSSVTVDEADIPQSTGISTSGWLLVDGRIVLRGYRFTRGKGNVALAYRSGYEAIPQDVQQAVLELAADRYQYRTRVGVMNRNVAGDSTTFVSFQVPASVQTVIDSYKAL